MSKGRKRVTSSSIVSSLAVRSLIGSLVLCTLLAASGCASDFSGGVGGAGGSTLGNAGAGLSAFQFQFQAPTIWGNLVLLALSVGIFMSTLGLRK